MRENLRLWHLQRKAWYRAAETEGRSCPCGGCSSAYLDASGSLSKLRAFIHAPCGKKSYPAVAIDSGPKQRAEVEFYARQCCRAPLIEGDECKVCGWERTMPQCPIEQSEKADAEWKEYHPRIEPDGRSFQDELVTRQGSRKQFMAYLRELYRNWSPHD